MMMNICRTCLKTPAGKDISQLEKVINEDDKNYFYIMEFCLDIKVIQDSKITTKLCNNCYRKVISFYEFKAQSLKNDMFLKSLNPAVSIVDQKLSVYVDENGIKHENFLDTDEYGPILLEDGKSKVEIEINLKNEDSLGYEYEYLDSNEESPSEEQTANENMRLLNESDENAANVKEKQRTLKSKHIPNESKEKKQSPAHKKRCRSKKVKQPQKHSKKDYEMCQECGKSFRNLKQHIISHQPKDQRRMLQCKGCPKLFFTKRGQICHYRTAHLGIKSKCDICNKEVVSLTVHKLLMHDKEALPFGCLLCSRRFLSRSAVKSHMSSHTKEYAYECDDCQKKFGSKQNVLRHILQVHTKATNFECHICSKRFFKKSAMQDHLRSHTKERPFECAECGKSFSYSSTLRSHQLTHGDVKSFRCEVCGMRFLKAAYLKVHMISHTKERRHPCQYCGVRFGRSDHRRRHEFTAHQKHLAND